MKDDPRRSPRPEGGHRDRRDETGPEETRGAGTVNEPIPPGEVQPGETNEAGSTLGGPVDVFPVRRRKPSQSGE